MKLERKGEEANPGTKVLKIMLIKARNYEHANPYSKSRPPSTPQFPKTKTSKNMEEERRPKSTGTRNVSLINSLFMPCDVNNILCLPLSGRRP